MNQLVSTSGLPSGQPKQLRQAIGLLLAYLLGAFDGARGHIQAAGVCSNTHDEQAVADLLNSTLGFNVFVLGLLLPLGFLFASWSLPRQQRNNDRRLLLALAAPVSLLLVFLLFRGLVDWP
ncbi:MULTISPECIES: hypothetical protein [unclassified Streptomyces]|uniref:hypothetical protein n=1 Tax=unclassified Streptomyces TaxID=2593676 RepID=UPI00225857F4|nr:hypothetical protein [Streptomyces sp. NBC_01306]MCX4726254.1 hypothetical protein [Streptomyces sp. NBC_01306]WSX69479.1 hypothetical protein OG221_24345 [Streptomyces sp. NBC_00932]